MPEKYLYIKKKRGLIIITHNIVASYFFLILL